MKQKSPPLDKDMISIPPGALMNIDRHISGPNIVFHYTSLKVASKHILPTLSLRFGAIRNTNDPKEYTGVDPAIERHGGYSHEMLLKVLRERFNRRAFKQVKCLCFCRNNKRIKAYLKLRMWAQYGDNSRGVCIALDADKLKAKIDDFQERMWFGNMRYINRIAHREKHTKLLIVNPINRRHAYEQADKQADEVIRIGYFEKHHDFRDESEFRIATSSRKHLHLDISDAIISVIVGPRVSEAQCQPLVSRFPTIEVQKLTWYPHGASLHFLNDPYHRQNDVLAHIMQTQALSSMKIT